ncbi:uncharacterized protein [Lolium perenne]|uniref:uncharacterized protein isoform X2 n=1 Tax=Lolium perenne TaxID=4522 RepID=UPI003A9983C8
MDSKHSNKTHSVGWSIGETVVYVGMLLRCRCDGSFLPVDQAVLVVSLIAGRLELMLPSVFCRCCGFLPWTTSWASIMQRCKIVNDGFTLKQFICRYSSKGLCEFPLRCFKYRVSTLPQKEVQQSLNLMITHEDIGRAFFQSGY